MAAIRLQRPNPPHRQTTFFRRLREQNSVKRPPEPMRCSGILRRGRCRGGHPGAHYIPNVGCPDVPPREYPQGIPQKDLWLLTKGTRDHHRLGFLAEGLTFIRFSTLLRSLSCSHSFSSLAFILHGFAVVFPGPHTHYLIHTQHPYFRSPQLLFNLIGL